ncbi:MAG: leucine-rich repeat domain-containing protein [Clostridium sp.]|uniref:leucine-rich repeat domain-containing protein n=1 Tax=Clostridium sp. TaxID=1506 RepID=UPI003D6CCE6B
MRQIKKTLIIFIAVISVMAGNLGNVVAKAEVVNPVTPIINYVGVDHSPLVVGDTETFTVTSSKFVGKVQYRAFLFDGKKWNELTSGYSAEVDAKTPYVLPKTPAFKSGKYKLSVWVKRAGTTGSIKKSYDNYYAEALNCVTKDNAIRVYAGGAPKVETNGLTFKFNGIENIGGIKGPYLYKLHIYNPRTGVWTSASSEYTETPSYIFKEAGTYMVIVHANTVNSPTWKNYIAGKTKGAYEAFKTIMVTVNDSSVEIFKSTIKPADTGLGAIGSITLTADGVKNYPTAKKYQIFEGTTPISDIVDLGTATTVYPAKVAGNMVNVKLLDASATVVKEISVALGKSGTISAISNGTDITSKFTDKYFKSYVYSLIGKTSPSPILYSDVKDIKTLNFYSENMSNLCGIEYFKALTELVCSNKVARDLSDAYVAPGLTTLDVSKNTALTKLECRYNQLTTLDVSKNTSLTELDCISNQLTTLDVSKNTTLTKLYCGGNKLTTLDVSKNISLAELDCAYNQLTTLDVSKNAALIYLNCDSNKLTTLDASKNSALSKLKCNSNQLTTLDTNPALTKLECYNNKLALDLSKNTALTELNCQYNKLTALDVSKNTALTNLDCVGNELTTLDLSKNTALTNLDCQNNNLTTLDVSKNIVLTDLFCTNNQLTTLFYNNKLTTYYVQRETWYDWYKLQYTDSSHTKTTNNLVLTAKD